MQMKTKPVVIALMAAGLALPVLSHAADGRHQDRSDAKVWVKDSVITAKIKSELASKRLASLTHISVDTDANGHVQLTGFARTQSEVDQAGRIARAVEGVKSVDNQLKVKADL
jgi:hyperosmotically inducible protein